MASCLFSLLVTSCTLLAQAQDECTNEITDVAEFYTHKENGIFDLLIDVRTINEYTGNGDEACNAGKADKCNMGHDPDMWMLTNADRDDQAVLYKVDGANTVDPKIIESLKSCYGDRASTMKILVSCHSGSRSYAMQQALVAAGFACGNMYNLRPGADGLFKADPSKLVKTNDQKGPWTCAGAPPPPCTNEITDVAEFYTHKANGVFDLLVDVRTLNEYTGNGDEACNAGKADKCNMGHDPEMWMLTNEDRDDKAVLYKVDGKNTVDPKIVASMKACYGSEASAMKILVSCHSGSRSYAMQQALVDAGFSCGNIYNLRPGADGLFKADPSKLVKTNDQKGPWTCPTPAPPTAATEAPDASGSKITSVAPLLVLAMSAAAALVAA